MNADATSRYAAADTRYIAAFDAEASPARLHLALALADVAWSPPDRDRLTLLDLGCGLGLTALTLAAANPGWDVMGLDLQPAHVAEAREIAAEAGIGNARFLEADLAGFDAASAARRLPQADIVLCRGVWTWVPDAVRQGIVGVLAGCVKPGGIVLMGYNALPAQADSIPLQRLIAEAMRGVPGGVAERAAVALDMIIALRDGGSPYLPPAHILDRIIAVGRTSPAYMAHQWLTETWRPVFQAELARDLAAARLDYAGPARPSAGMADLQLRPPQRAAIAALPAGMEAETVLDHFLERRFRTDIFVRGRRPGGRVTLGRIRFALGVDAAHANPRLATLAGVATLPPPARAAVLGALSEGPRLLADLAALPGAEDAGVEDIALILAETNIAHPLWRDPPGDRARHDRTPFASQDPTRVASQDPTRVASQDPTRFARCDAVLLRRLGAEIGAAGAPVGAIAPALGSGLPMAAEDLALLVALRAGAPADPALLAARLAPGAEDPGAVADGIARTLALRLAAWRDLGLA